MSEPLLMDHKRLESLKMRIVRDELLKDERDLLCHILALDELSTDLATQGGDWAGKCAHLQCEVAALEEQLQAARTIVERIMTMHWDLATCRCWICAEGRQIDCHPVEQHKDWRGTWPYVWTEGQYVAIPGLTPALREEIAAFLQKLQGMASSVDLARWVGDLRCGK